MYIVQRYVGKKQESAIKKGGKRQLFFLMILIEIVDSLHSVFI